MLQVIAADLIGSGQRGVGDPWGLDKFDLGGVTVFQTDVARIVIAALAWPRSAVFFKYTRWGLAMRATAFNQETALAQGVPVGRMFAFSWVLAGALGAIAGMLVGTGGAGFDQTTTLIALKALPAIILGGLDSIRGAIVGGLVIGLAEAYTKAYQADYFAWPGSNFDQVVPYLVMLIVLLVRPYGLYGTRRCSAYEGPAGTRDLLRGGPGAARDGGQACLFAFVALLSSCRFSRHRAERADGHRLPGRDRCDRPEHRDRVGRPGVAGPRLLPGPRAPTPGRCSPATRTPASWGSGSTW